VEVPAWKDDELLTQAQVAAHMGISDRALRDLVREGQFPRPIRWMGMKRWRWATVRTWIAAVELVQALTPKLLVQISTPDGKDWNSTAEDETASGSGKKRG
jgi:predicted DNA-binding transcriptional regulator AlpA